MEAIANKITGEQAIKFIQSRTQINEPGKYAVQVISVNPHNGKFIVGLKAQSMEGLEKAKNFLREGRYDEAGNTNMSTNVFADASFIPSKGEHVSIMVDYVTNREGKSILGVTNISEIKAKVATKVNLGDEFANLLDSKKEESTEEDLNTPD